MLTVKDLEGLEPRFRTRAWSRGFTLSQNPTWTLDVLPLWRGIPYTFMGHNIQGPGRVR